MYYELTPAYGRDYKTKVEVLAAWDAGKDFEGDHQLGFKLVNKADLAKHDPNARPMLRYKSGRQVVAVPVPKGVMS